MADELDQQLRYACRSGNLDRVQRLINDGANSSCTDDDGRTPLHIAAWWGRLKVVRYLAEKVEKVNVNAGDEDGHTPLHIAAQRGELEVVRYLAEKVEKVNVNAGDDDGQTPLHIAALTGKLEVVRYLAEKVEKVNVNAGDKQGWTPLYVALLYGYTDIVRLLLFVARCHPSPRAHNGLTPLDRAVIGGHQEIVNFFTSTRDDGGSHGGKYITSITPCS